MAKIGITETVLRDAHQSLIATRMRTDEFEGILEKMDKIGYHSLECWGGATFDSCLRFLDEDPWDRLRLIRKKCPNTKLQIRRLFLIQPVLFLILTTIAIMQSSLKMQVLIQFVLRIWQVF